MNKLRDGDESPNTSAPCEEPASCCCTASSEVVNLVKSERVSAFEASEAAQIFSVYGEEKVDVIRNIPSKEASESEERRQDGSRLAEFVIRDALLLNTREAGELLLSEFPAQSVISDGA